MEGFEWKMVSSMEKVFPVREPSGEGVGEKLTALRGETVSFQIAYRWSGSRREKMHPELCGKGKGMARIRKVCLVPCEYPLHPESDEDYLTREPGLYPDLLQEISGEGVNLIPGQWRSLWVDLEAQDSSVPGGYPVSVRMVRNGECMGTAEMSFEILNADLPPLPIPHTEWFHSDCLAEYYQVEVFSEEYWRITENFIRAAVKRKCNMILTPVFTPPLDTAVGGYRLPVQLTDVVFENGHWVFGFEKLRRWVEMCRRCGIVYYEISHLFTQWGAKCTPQIFGTKDEQYQRIFGWETDAGSPEYTEFLHSFLCALKKELKQLGILEHTFFHVSDEPGEAVLESYQKAVELVAEDLGDCQVIDALSEYAFYKKGLVRQPVCSLDHIQPFLEKRPEKLWGYYCTSQAVNVPNRFIVQPGYRTRILGTLLYRYQLDGFLHWGYNFYHSQFSTRSIDPYLCTDADGAFPSGDPFLVYPGRDGIPEESQRMMLMDEAMSDLCALKLLEQMAGKETAYRCLEVQEGEELNFEKYPRRISYLAGMREKVNDEIRKRTE